MVEIWVASFEFNVIWFVARIERMEYRAPLFFLTRNASGKVLSDNETNIAEGLC